MQTAPRLFQDKQNLTKEMKLYADDKILIVDIKFYNFQRCVRMNY